MNDLEPKQVAAAPSAIDFDGKYGVSLTFPTSTDGFATVGGFLDNTTSVGPWIERTTDGGRRWQIVASPAAGGVLRFNTSEDGWSVAPGGLRLTTDGGRSWRTVAVSGDVTALDTAGEGTWLIASRTEAHSETTCGEELLVSRGLGEAPVLAASQPHFGSECMFQLVAATASTAYVLLAAPRAGPTAFEVTTDGGASWNERSTPCARLEDVQLSLAASGDSVWLTCTYGQALDTFEDHQAKSYRSTDGGRTWTAVLTSLLAGGVDEMSVQPRLRNVLFIVPKSFSASGHGAAIVLETYPKSSKPQTYEHFVVGVTQNGGLTWHWSYLPNVKGDFST